MNRSSYCHCYCNRCTPDLPVNIELSFSTCDKNLKSAYSVMYTSRRFKIMNWLEISFSKNLYLR